LLVRTQWGSPRGPRAYARRRVRFRAPSVRTCAIGAPFASCRSAAGALRDAPCGDPHRIRPRSLTMAPTARSISVRASGRSGRKIAPARAWVTRRPRPHAYDLRAPVSLNEDRPQGSERGRRGWGVTRGCRGVLRREAPDANGAPSEHVRTRRVRVSERPPSGPPAPAKLASEPLAPPPCNTGGWPGPLVGEILAARGAL